ncbi:MAG: transposase [Actinobacteria bacterium]|nr:transposase [Actinomycetota bacterium]
MIDAKRVGQLCCAIAASRHYVCNWSYGERENSRLWATTLGKLPQPKAVVCDGQKGILKALGYLWPGVVIQRCHFHVQLNMRTKLTLNPQTAAGQDLKVHLSTLKDVVDAGSMDHFIVIFHELHKQHEDFLKARTVNPNPAPGQRKWWYTHRSVRSAYRQMDGLIASGHLFAFLIHPGLDLPRTTNRLEGGINSPMQELLHRHRGLKQQHQLRLADWYLDSRSETPYLTQKTPRNGY